VVGPIGSSGRFQHHHLIPQSIAAKPQIGPFLRGLHLAGFHVEDRRFNLLPLASDEATAVRLGIALHRGPHPRYTAVVLARVERIRALHHRERRDGHYAAQRLRRLQRALAAVLAGSGPRLLQLNRRDPMRLFADYSALDAAIATITGDG
jgi:hypothetical protein